MPGTKTPKIYRFYIGEKYLGTMMGFGEKSVLKKFLKSYLGPNKERVEARQVM